ncbi:MAG: hypothetical protein HY716_03545 [Planctomycetes bacterium]|nr:hypothetical protein [Planctomycetota bacterium]
MRRSCLVFAASCAGLFAVMAVHAPGAASQDNQLIRRMMFMHLNNFRHLSFIDTEKRPTPSSLEVVGKFEFAVSQSTGLVSGRAFPSPVNPDYIYGVTQSGTTLRQVGTAGTPMASYDFGQFFARFGGAFLVTDNLPKTPPHNTFPRGYDLKEHYVIVGEMSAEEQLRSGNTTGMMLVNPATMTPYRVGGGSLFFGPATNVTFDGVCFGAYPGDDGDYDTIDDNEYRYFVAYTVQGTIPECRFAILSLNKHETTNGQDPPDPWNPISATRGPDYTNVFPRMDSNPKFGGGPFDGGQAAGNSEVYCQSYYLRPGVPGCGAIPDRAYVVAGYTREIPGLIIVWRPILGAYSLGLPSVTIGPVALYTGGPPWHPFCKGYTVPNIFRSLDIIGDWAFATTGFGDEGIGGDQIEMVYVPEMIDGAGDGDDGYRGFWQPPDGSSAGYAGFMPNEDFSVYAVYLGAGLGTSTAYGSTRSPVSIPAWTPSYASGGTGMTGIDMHREDEQLLGMNIRQAPQPFAGFHMSVDPVENFDGAGAGGSGRSGACTGSVDGAGSHGMAALAGLLSMAFLGLQIIREARRS